MKILLTDTKSILEYLYRKSLKEEVSLTMDISKATAVVNTSFNKNFYDKTIIVTSNKQSNISDLVRLSKVNKVISRLPLGEVGFEYTLEPYVKVKLENLKMENNRNKPISDLSIKDFIITKYKGNYYMDAPSSYLGTSYKGNLTLVGLLKHQKEP
jgi:hypothetical protein